MSKSEHAKLAESGVVQRGRDGKQRALSILETASGTGITKVVADEWIRVAQEHAKERMELLSKKENAEAIFSNLRGHVQTLLDWSLKLDTVREEGPDAGKLEFLLKHGKKGKKGKKGLFRGTTSDVEIESALQGSIRRLFAENISQKYTKWDEDLKRKLNSQVSKGTWMNYSAFGTVACTVCYSVSWIAQGAHKTIEELRRSTDETAALTLRCEQERLDAGMWGYFQGLSPNECGLDLSQKAVTGAGVIDASLVWGFTYIGIPLFMSAASYGITTHMANKYYSRLPLDTALDNLTEFSYEINNEVCNLYLEQWIHLLTTLKQDDPNVCMHIATLIQRSTSTEHLESIFSEPDNAIKEAELTKLTNMVISDMITGFTTRVKGSLEGPAYYTKSEIADLRKLRTVAISEAGKIKENDVESLELLTYQYQEGKRATVNIAGLLSGAAMNVGGTAASMFTNAAGLTTSGMGRIVKMGAGFAMGGPAGAAAAYALGKKRTMKKQKKGRKGSKKRGRNKKK